MAHRTAHEVNANGEVLCVFHRTGREAWTHDLSASGACEVCTDRGSAGSVSKPAVARKAKQAARKAHKLTATMRKRALRDTNEALTESVAVETLADSMLAEVLESDPLKDGETL
jgi:hypothetical protein